MNGIRAIGVGAIVLLAGTMLSACGDKAGSSDTAPAPKRPAKAHLVTALEVERAPVSARHERPGTLTLRRIARIYSQEEGRITELALFEGDQIRQGDLLVRLDDTLLRAELDKARATVAQEQLDVRRQEKLDKTGAASQDDLAQARTALKLAEAQLRVLQTRLAYTRIEAPMTGVLTERLVEPGDFVAKNTHLLTIADPASLIAEADVSELVLPHIAVGDPARIRVDALGGRHFDGRILRIHPTLAETSRQAKVEVQFDALPAGARAGQFVRVELATAAVPRLLIPFRALRQDRDGPFVWIIDAQDKAARRPVEPGLRMADRIEVLDGLESGARLITRGFLGLAAGKRVEVIDTQQDTASISAR